MKTHFTSEYCNILIHPNDVVELVVNDTNPIDTIEKAAKVVEAANEICSKGIYGVITEMPSNYMSKDVMKVFEDSESYEVASAMIARSFGAKVLGNFFLRMLKNKANRPPVKLFTNREKAEKWLLEHIATAKQKLH